MLLVDGLGATIQPDGQPTAIGRYKRLMGDGLRFHQDGRRATEVAVAVHVLNRMLELGRPISVRIA